MPALADASACAAASRTPRCRGGARARPAARRVATPCRCQDAGRRSDARPARAAARPAGPPVPRGREAAPPPRRGYGGRDEDAYADGGDDNSDDAADVLLSRSQLLTKSVITRTSGENLGVVTQLWVDVTTWEVLALDVRPSALAGEQAVVALASLRQVGDVILVHDARAAQRRGPPPGALPLVGVDIVTQTGEYLGKVRDYEFDPEDGRVATLIFDAFGLPLVPASVVSVYSLSIAEVVSAGAERVVVRAGAEARVSQLTASLLQRLQLVEPPWEESLRLGEAGYGYGDEYVPQRYGSERERATAWYDERRRGAPAYPADDVYAAARGPPRALPREASAQPAPQRRRAPQQQQQQQQQQQAPSRSQGIPLVRRAAPSERRDADGRYGEQAAQDDVAQEGRAFDAWVTREPQRQREAAAQPRSGGGGGGYDAREDLL